MVIISDTFGQLGNRLFLFAHFIANAKEFDYRVCYPGFQEYAHYFTGTRNSLVCQYPAGEPSPVKRIRIKKYINSFLTLLATNYARTTIRLPHLTVLSLTEREGEGDYDLGGGEYKELRETTPFLIAQGWLFRDERNFHKHADTVRHYFSPARPFSRNISSLISSARNDCDLLVGIHIRQGDYEFWQDGRYYYKTAEYVNILRDTVELWPGKRVRYLICSNEKQDTRLFNGLNCTGGTGEQLEDMYAFAACDYLIGPPSTYTMWASFYGSVPLFVINDLHEPITLEGFTVC